MNSQQFENYKAFLATLNIENLDIPYFADENHTSFEDLENSITDGNGFDVEIIYYSRAMEYLTANDASLKTSLEIAEQHGYSPSSLSSELLASLLASENCRTEFHDLEAEIQTFFDELSEDTDEL